MIMRIEVSRRAFIKAAGLMSLVGAASAGTPFSRDLPKDSLKKRLTDFLKVDKNASVIGVAYLVDFPEDWM